MQLEARPVFHPALLKLATPVEPTIPPTTIPRLPKSLRPPNQQVTAVTAIIAVISAISVIPVIPVNTGRPAPRAPEAFGAAFSACARPRQTRTARSPVRVSGLLIWQRPTLAGPIVRLPLALRRFTSVFGMGTGGSTALWSPEAGRAK